MKNLSNKTEDTPLLPKENDEKRRRHSCILCDPFSRWHRYIVLLFICFISFGVAYVYDNLSALHDKIIDDLNLSEERYMALYSWYSWPNVVLCVFCGFIIDAYIGVRLGTIALTGFTLVGQIVLAAGAGTNTYWAMCLGRFFLGIGGESIYVIQSVYAIKWFKGSELHTVFGLLSTTSQVAGIVNMNTMGVIYRMVNKALKVFGYQAIGVSLFISSSFCLLSFLCACILALLDRRGDRIMCRSTAHSQKTMNIKDMKDYPKSVWCISVISMTFTVAFLPFISIGKVFFMMKYDLSQKTANLANSIILIIAAVFFPLIGVAIDFIGKNIFWLIVGALIGIGGHSLLAFTFINPFVGLSFLGLSFAVVQSTLYPLVAFVVPEHSLGTIYGVMQALLNLGLGVIDIVSGAIADSSGYLIVEIFFLMWIAVTVVLSLLLYVHDIVRGGLLNMASRERNLYLKLNKEE